MTRSLDLKVRYFQDSPREGLPYREEHFIRRETKMSLPIKQTALVLVDTWDNHFILSWLERAEQIMREAVVPVLEASRAAALTIIHAPSPRVTPSYPEHMARHRPVDSGQPPTWPPAQFRARQGADEAFRGPRAQPPGVPDVEIGMSPLIDVRDNEELLETGDQLHELCEKRGILHLIMRALSQMGVARVATRDASHDLPVQSTRASGQRRRLEEKVRETTHLLSAKESR